MLCFVFVLNKAALASLYERDRNSPACSVIWLITYWPPCDLIIIFVPFASILILWELRNYIFSVDHQTITQKIAKKSLDGNKLSIEQVTVCNCVQVTGLNREKTTQDAVLYYFENPKNGGGDVIDVELNLKEGWALVHFEDPEGTKMSFMYLRKSLVYWFNIYT